MNRLTLDDIRARIEEIRRLSRDPESAHIAEDALYRYVLTMIAAGCCERPREAAALALTTRKIGFGRYYS